jgi:hypothetical protein
MDIFSDYAGLITILIALLAMRIFLPGILRPFRPQKQSTSTLNIINKLKAEDIQDFTPEQWERIKFIIGEEQKVISARASAQSNAWIGKIMGRQEEF